MAANTNLENLFKIEPSPNERNIYVVYKKVDRKNNLDVFLPVSNFPADSSPETDITFYVYPILSDEEKDFVKNFVKEFLQKL